MAALKFLMMSELILPGGYSHAIYMTGGRGQTKLHFVNPQKYISVKFYTPR